MSAIDRFFYLFKTSCYVVARPKLHRGGVDVENEYSEGWNQYWDHLKKARDLDAWLRIPGFEDGLAYFNVDGKLCHSAFDSMAYYRSKLVVALDAGFARATSVAEFGAGLGRNLLFLKKAMPHLTVYGYELCSPGVEIARKAAEKFGIDCQYSQLDYVRSPAAAYVFPETDVAFTMFSLEQVPRDNLQALTNIQAHCTQGSIHMEPVPENYPATLRGLLGRLDHWKVDYLAGFDRNVRLLPLDSVAVEILMSSHNPLMYPSLYVLRKTPSP